MSDWRTSFPRTIFVVQRKSFILKLKAQNIFLAAKIIVNFGDFFLPQKSLKMRDVLEKMRECGKLPNLRDFPHDCGMVDNQTECDTVTDTDSECAGSGKCQTESVTHSDTDSVTL